MTKTISSAMCLCVMCIHKKLCVVVVVKTMNLGQKIEVSKTKRRSTQWYGMSVYLYTVQQIDRLELICETLKRQSLLIRRVKYTHTSYSCFTQLNILDIVYTVHYLQLVRQV